MAGPLTVPSRSTLAQINSSDYTSFNCDQADYFRESFLKFCVESLKTLNVETFKIHLGADAKKKNWLGGIESQGRPPNLIWTGHLLKYDI